MAVRPEQREERPEQREESEEGESEDEKDEGAMKLGGVGERIKAEREEERVKRTKDPESRRGKKSRTTTGHISRTGIGVRFVCRPRVRI